MRSLGEDAMEKFILSLCLYIEKDVGIQEGAQEGHKNVLNLSSFSERHDTPYKRFRIVWGERECRFTHAGKDLRFES